MWCNARLDMQTELWYMKCPPEHPADNCPGQAPVGPAAALAAPATRHAVPAVCAAPAVPAAAPAVPAGLLGLCEVLG